MTLSMQDLRQRNASSHHERRIMGVDACLGRSVQRLPSEALASCISKAEERPLEEREQQVAGAARRTRAELGSFPFVLCMHSYSGHRS